MATMDQGIANLQRFITNLINATSAVGQVDEHFEAKAKVFDELEKSAGEEGDGLNHHFEEAGTALDTGKGEAESALADLGKAGHDGEQHLGESEQKIEQTATDLEQKVTTALHDVDQANTTLADSGFTALGHTIEEAEQALQKELQETEGKFNEFETAVQGFQTENEKAWHDGEHALETATTEMGQEQSTVEKDATEGVHGFETAATEMESHCTSLQGELETIYKAVTAGVETQGHEWEQHVQELGTQGTTFVHDGQQNRIDAPAGMLENEALHALSQEYETLGTVLEVAAATATELEPLGEDLVKSQVVVAQVDELMNALAG